jgi:hypothetical protein
LDSQREDFGWRSDHVNTAFTKAITAQHYGKPIKYSYLAGDSAMPLRRGSPRPVELLTTLWRKEWLGDITRDHKKRLSFLMATSSRL